MSQFRAQFLIYVYGVRRDDMDDDQREALAEELRMAAAMFAESIKRINPELMTDTEEMFL